MKWRGSFEDVANLGEPIVIDYRRSRWFGWRREVVFWLLALLMWLGFRAAKHGDNEVAARDVAVRNGG